MHGSACASGITASEITQLTCPQAESQPTAPVGTGTVSRVRIFSRTIVGCQIRESSLLMAPSAVPFEARRCRWVRRFSVASDHQRIARSLAENPASSGRCASGTAQRVVVPRRKIQNPWIGFPVFLFVGAIEGWIVVKVVQKVIHGKRKMLKPVAEVRVTRHRGSCNARATLSVAMAAQAEVRSVLDDITTSSTKAATLRRGNSRGFWWMRCARDSRRYGSDFGERG